MKTHTAYIVYLDATLRYIGRESLQCGCKGDMSCENTACKLSSTLSDMWFSVLPSHTNTDLSVFTRREGPAPTYGSVWGILPQCGSCGTKYQMWVKDCKCMRNAPMKAGVA